MRQLEREVRPQSFCVDAIEHVPVRSDDRTCLHLVAHALAEQRRVREETGFVQPPQDPYGIVDALPRDEPGSAEPEAVALHESLQPWTVRGREEEAAKGAHASHSRTIRSTSVRSSSLNSRSGGRTSRPTATPRNPSAAFDAAWKGNR